MRSVSSFMGPMDGVLSREGVSLLYWTNDRWEEEELWFGLWSLLMEIYGWSDWKDDRTAKATNSCWTRKPLPRIRREMGNDLILQQDNCSIHVSKLMKEWMAKVNMTTLEWPVRNPDLNLIENVSEMLVQLVYDGPEITKEAQTMGTNTRSQKTTNRNTYRCYCAYVWSLWREIDKSYCEERWYYRLLSFFNDVRKIMSRVFCKKRWKLNIFPYLIDFLPFLLQVLSLYVYAILLKEFRHSMVLGNSKTKMSEKYCRAPVDVCLKVVLSEKSSVGSILTADK